jgi:cytochrome c-type protein NapB
MNGSRRLYAIALIAAGVVGLAIADELGDGLRGSTALEQEAKAPPLAGVENTDVKRGRAYTSQPPTIPHTIERYEITRNVNFCMYCHSRVRNEEFGAPMVSATHFMDRDYDFLAEISPRRYFCTQCHVTQAVVKPPVDNRFIDVYELVEREQRRADPPAAPARQPRE